MAFTLALSAHAKAPQQRWVPATYHGLTTGVSTRADVLGILGRPGFSGREEDSEIPILSYEVTDPFPGHLVVFIRNGILSSLRLDLDKAVPKNDIVHAFGTNFVSKRVDVDDCRGAGGSAPVFQSKFGPIEQIEYRELGVSVSFNSVGRADAISYDYRSRIPTHSSCKEAKAKRVP